MEKAEKTNMAQLTAGLPILLGLREVLMRVKGRFQNIQYYENFKLHKHPPSILPIEEIKSFIEEILKTKAALIEFKKSFDENELGDDLRTIFLKIFIQIAKEDRLLSEGEIMLGGNRGNNGRSTSDIIDQWKTTKYETKLAYSMECYKFICEYLPLIDLIDQLEDSSDI